MCKSFIQYIFNHYYNFIWFAILFAGNIAFAQSSLPEVVPSTYTLNFGDVAYGYFKTDTITIKNTGVAPLEITNITCSGSVFTLVNTYTYPISVPVNDSIKIPIRFSPGNTIPYSESVTINHNSAYTQGSTNTYTEIDLVGTGVSAVTDIRIAPNPLNIPSAPIRSYVDSVIIIKNTGTIALTVSDISISGTTFTLPNNEHINVSGVMPIILAPEQTYSLTVRFSPTNTITFSGTITIVHNASGSPSTIDLSGTGTNAIIGTDVGRIDFGSVKVGNYLEKSVKILNMGTTLLNISSIALPVGFNLPNNDSTIMVYSNNYYELKVQFTPDAAQAYSSSIVLTHNASGSPTRIPVTGTGIIVAANATPAVINFGNVKPGTTNEATIAITNRGSVDITITNIVLNNANEDKSFSHDFARSVTLRPNGQTRIRVKFNPITSGEKSGTLIIPYEDEEPITVALTGFAKGAIVKINPPEIDFKDVLVSSTSTEKLTITNEGNDDLKISSFSFTGTDANMFAFVSTPILPITIAPSYNIILTFQFSPTSLGEKNAEFNIVHDNYNSPSIIPFTGRGVKPDIAIVPDTLNFGDVLTAPGDIYQEGIKSFEISNVGTAPLIISDITKEGDDAEDFIIYSELDSIGSETTIAPNESKNFYVKFNPSTDGAKSSIWNISHNADNSPSSLYLQGKGVSPKIVIEESLINFGNVMLDSSSIKTVTIKNIGDGMFIIASFNISLNTFTLPNNETTLRIAPGESYDLLIQFIPTAIRDYSGNITLIHNAGSPSNILLEGKGVQPSITTDKSNIDFGEVKVSSLKAETFIIKNNGTGNLIISSLSFTGVDSNLFRFENNYYVPITLAPNHGVGLVVRFAPTSAGAKQASINLNHNVNQTSVVVSLAGNGIAERIAFNPYDVLNFGGVPVSKTEQASVTISNTGATKISIMGLEITGTDASMFKRVPETQFQNISIESDSIYVFTFSFMPTSAGAKNAKLIFTHELGTTEIDLRGVGLTPNIALEPDRLEFGNVLVGSEKYLTLEITNTGEAILKLLSIRFGGVNASSFGLFPMTADITIPPSITLPIVIKFSPEVLGQRTATLEVVTDLITSESINLIGTGVSTISVEEPEDIVVDGNTFLFQSNPNPIRSGYDASIKYRLSNAGQVNLVVYDVLGREVVKLVDEYKPQGMHSANFNTKNLPSGVYFYKLRTPGYEGLNKMLIIR
jgi:hypothetical protein